ncbi:MAG: sigma-70 family RNA polymerase sigma factor [Planctomycetaceae bacterium]|nr:sigma-70 family RNA polymerase sigma factor [Planctomycetaceae bacterium]
MVDNSDSNLNSEQSLSQRVANGDTDALQSLFRGCRARLKQMIQLRISQQLQRRVDASDIVQEALLQAAVNIDDYKYDPDRPFYLWIRKIAENKLIEAHRRHFLAAKRDARKELAIPPEQPLSVNSNSLAKQLLIGGGSSPASKAIKAEARQMIHEGLDELEPVDREVLVLHHFEQLSMSEIGLVLGISKSGASKRYLKALDRFREILEKVPGLLDPPS